MTTSAAISRYMAGAAAALLLSLSTSAQAYDRTTCNQLFAEANVSRAVQFRINAGKADFGDDPHLLGSPQGTAVICWAIDGRAAVVGKLYADDGVGDPSAAIARITFERSNGQRITVRHSIIGNFAASTRVRDVSPLGVFNRVIIQLRVAPCSSDHECFGETIVASRTFNR